ncbi:Tc toxin subunit A [Xenorhabdus bovienii]|uniref:Tc toxin subunit A n=1 Tax=Xenorhabdus bovienii TaxID=40576 RepID=UPI0023B2AE57|nr:Tc toxin subunit A [Xenorhabdus bovienii]MDE9463154.1 toxin [Xenorhabdus bovienii]MDE9470939.1 toxin [Xenorhabdus bovienii]
MSDIFTFLSPHQRDYITQLNDNGYHSVFDIVRLGRAAFINALKDVPENESRKLYQQASQRADNLKSLYRAWQLRQEPVIAGLKKLDTASSQPLHDALVRNIGGDGDFSDLMERSSEYADAASIQSLFSPGRYAGALYKVAKTLHVSTSDLHIDNRRPDLKNLILSEATMNQEVTSLDILLDVLQGENTDLKTLADTYYPMTLPYDDSLTQINAALIAQGRTLNGIGESLSDSLSSALSPATYSYLLGDSSKKEGQLDGQKFYLKALKDGEDAVVYLSSPSQSGSSASARLTLGKPQAAAIAAAPLIFSWLPGYKKNELYLGVHGDEVINGISLKNCFLTGSSGQNNGKDGIYALMENRNSGLNTTHHLLITVENNTDGTSLKLSTQKGYLGWKKDGPASDWKDPLILDASEDDALAFILCKDATGKPLEDASIAFPVKADTQPSPPTRNTLSLSPNSYQLLVKETPTLDDVVSHYGLKGTTRSAQTLGIDATTLAKALNDSDTFCQKTSLTFNQLLALTAQQLYSKNGQDTHASSRFTRFGETPHTNVNIYGAAFLNGGLSDNEDNYGKYLWVQKDGKSLNFKPETVVELAGRAEKLVRLANATGLTFEALDWLVVNASRNANDPTRGNDIILDKPVLDTVATYVSLKQRYGIDVNTFVTFVGAANPYAADQEKSFYEATFCSLDGDITIPLGTVINVKEGECATLCCKALGVTSEEFSRIANYCFGQTDEFKLDENTAGQIYRFGAIPQMLGLTFAQAEALWQLLADGRDTLLRLLGTANTLNALGIITRTENVLAWMTDSNLSLVQLQGMVSHQFSATATAEMFTFLQSTFNSVNVHTDDKPSADVALTQKLQRALASGFSLKANVMAQLLHWLENISRSSEMSFTVDEYWEAIRMLFTGDEPASLDSLQQNLGLVLQTQRLSQLVLIVQWLGLTEQDLTLITTDPAQLNANWQTSPAPEPFLLLQLSRFKKWQTQVTASRDEALRLLTQLNDKAITSEQTVALIATLHGLNDATVAQMNQALFVDAWPKSFSSLWQLLSWLRTGETLNVGGRTLNGLLTMMHSDTAAENAELIKQVAQSLSAGISQR